jgi:hypothetical protein
MDNKNSQKIVCKTYKEAEEVWIKKFLHNKKYKTKVIGKTIIYWNVKKGVK